MQTQLDLNAAAAALQEGLLRLKTALDDRGYSKPDISLYLTDFKYSGSPSMIVIYPLQGISQLRFSRFIKAHEMDDAFAEALRWIAEVPFNVEWTPALIEQTLGIDPLPSGPVLVAAE